MRILFSFVGGPGHADPLVPFATAAQAAGHTVAFAGSRSVVPRLDALGFTAFARPVAEAETANADGGSASAQASAFGSLLALDREREDRDLRDHFAGSLARRQAAWLLGVCAEWSPDVVVRDEMDFGSVIAAERLGIPHATVLVLAAGSFVRASVVGAPLHALRAEHGLPPDPDLDMLSRYLVLSPLPPGYRDPAFPLPATAHSFRPPAGAAGAPGGREPALDWRPALPGAPTVYFTLGTEFNVESGDLFTRVLAGLGDLPVNVVVTVGRNLDPRALGPQPTNVHLARYIAQSAILPRCDLVISHGGSGTVVGALAAGLPSVIIPMGADQPGNADRCVALGVGRALDAVLLTPGDVRAAALDVLASPGYRRAAERLRDEIAALPEAGEAVTLLARLAADHPRGRPTPIPGG